MSMLNGNHNRRLGNIEKNFAGNVKLLWRDCGETKTDEQLKQDWHKERPGSQRLPTDEYIILSWKC